MTDILNPLTVVVNTLTKDNCKLTYMTLAERARYARKRLQMTQADAATLIGCSRGTVAMWESGGSASIGQYLLPAAKVYKVNPDWLDSGKGSDDYPWTGRVIPVRAFEVEAVESDEDFDPSSEVWVDGVEVEVSGGSGRIVPEFVPTQYRQRYTLKWFQETGANPANVKVMRVRGNSMERTLFDGDKVAVDTGNVRLASNHVYVVVMGDEVRVKRLFRTADGRVRIVSDNADKTLYPDEFVEDDAFSFMIIGRVIDRSGRGGL
ncbi:phage repressor protein C with HTH and peptisase S24 domain [Luteibacter sp. Sphag1AF]|uniref:S24 family peptidase n=1 Tax=Luteibacter sp. Sphag1AF TaxID=2587031 RepID=UPI00161C0660|nr:S24 family peptidase [Luteibacter sp. Sphag1AF]MBB3227029.1 phage repressor protein C with HTH and peptisase S24 domain [Luteibacter sp. Sphag1AF]